jgi:hypothetical protein
VALRSVHPSSTSGTKSGQARVVMVASGVMARMALSYAPELMVPMVPITPMLPEREVCTAARAPGSTTPMTGTGSSALSTGSACAVAVLQATTIALTPCSWRKWVISRL